MSDSRYVMTISLNVLNHLGLNLYSNTPAVLSEVIANAWDADATDVKVDFNINEKTITVADNGHGMKQDDINAKYLYVGHQKRATSADFRTPGGRKPMGRKGIGKLSLFSIANKIFVYSHKQGGEKEAFIMDADKIKEAIKSEDPSSPKQYKPEPTVFDVSLPTYGTVIKITELKKLRLTQASITGLKKRIARRFCIINDSVGFRIFVNGEEVTFADRDYFHKARFLFQYGGYDYAQHCNNLDTDGDTGRQLFYERECRFDQHGNASEDGEYNISGWIAIARHSNDLDDAGQAGDGQDANLNKITIVVRGKVAQEDILQEYRLGGMITKYIYGEINADFLDDDDKPDIATSSRQRISEDDPRYLAIKSFLGNELRHIWTETNKLKEKKGLDMALSSNPHIREWYEGLTPRNLQQTAKKIFIDIDQSGVDEAYKQGLYANGILAFETLKMQNALKMLETIDTSNIEAFLSYLSDIDAIEATHYQQIVQERLNVIKTLQDNVEENARERVLQEYIFNHLWLLDPAWERATEYAEMEKAIQAVVRGIPQDDKHYRVDIRYKRVMASHVIVELKRASRKLSKTDIESQVRKYIDAVRSKLKKMDEQPDPLETVCIVGELPYGWDDLEVKRRDEESLRPLSIRIITYDQLIKQAFSAYSKFIKASESTGKLQELINKIREYKPETLDAIDN